MKLFKKVAAAVLAGVMALSMVACANTPVVPEEKPIDQTAPAEQQVMDKLNEYVDLYAKMNSLRPVTLENTLKDEAQAVLDALAAGEYKDGDITFKSTELVKLATLKEALTKATNNNATVYMTVDGFLKKNGSTVKADTLDSTLTAVLGTVTVSLSEYRASQLKLNASDIIALVGTRLTANDTDSIYKDQLKANKKIGVASKEIGGKTYVIVVVR